MKSIIINKKVTIHTNLSDLDVAKYINHSLLNTNQFENHFLIVYNTYMEMVDKCFYFNILGNYRNAIMQVERDGMTHYLPLMIPSESKTLKLDDNGDRITLRPMEYAIVTYAISSLAAINYALLRGRKCVINERVYDLEEYRKGYCNAIAAANSCKMKKVIAALIKHI